MRQLFLGDVVVKTKIAYRLFDVPHAKDIDASRSSQNTNGPRTQPRLGGRSVVTLVVSSVLTGLAQYMVEAAEEKRRMEANREAVLNALGEADQVPDSFLMLTDTDADEFRAAAAAQKAPSDSRPKDSRAALADAISAAK